MRGLYGLPLTLYGLPTPMPTVVAPVPTLQAGPAQSPLMPLFGTLTSVPSLTISCQIITLPTGFFLNHTFLASLVINIRITLFPLLFLL